MEKVKKFAPGQTVWIITRDELGIPFGETSGFMFLAKTGPAVIVASFIDLDGECLDYGNTVNELIQENREGDAPGVYLFPESDAFDTLQEAEEELAYELSTTPETEGQA